MVQNRNSLDWDHHVPWVSCEFLMFSRFDMIDFGCYFRHFMTSPPICQGFVPSDKYARLENHLVYLSSIYLLNKGHFYLTHLFTGEASLEIHDRTVWTMISLLAGYGWAGCLIFKYIPAINGGRKQAKGKVLRR